ncbi:MAG: adenylyl-sulfate kinase [Dehalococcoidia bacterium]|nr:adenylyl-sulfate kinase [Dehalococcoidia bacterium]
MAEKQETVPGWVIWFVGLPGAGKSTYARAVWRALQEKGVAVDYLSMDERRKAYSAGPAYTEAERVTAYRLFAEEAASMAHRGRNVIMDGTAHRLSMREHMRRLVPRFAEVYVRCSLETAMMREKARPEGMIMARLYEKALQRKKTGTQFEGLGEVVGVDTEFEENPAAECVIDSERESVEEGRDKVLSLIARWQ